MENTSYVIFVRHAHTNYTNISPDITEEGVEALSQTAAIIKDVARGQLIHLHTSPQVRAVDSCGCLEKSIVPTPLYIGIVADLNAVKVYNNEAAMREYLSHRSTTDPYAVERAYWNNQAFDDTSIFEPRTSVKARLYHFLSSLFIRRKTGPACHVCVSHFENITHILYDAFGCDYTAAEYVPLRCAEAVILRIQPVLDQKLMVDVTFRDRSAVGALTINSLNRHRPILSKP